VFVRTEARADAVEIVMQAVQEPAPEAPQSACHEPGHQRARQRQEQPEQQQRLAAGAGKHRQGQRQGHGKPAGAGDPAWRAAGAAAGPRHRSACHGHGAGADAGRLQRPCQAVSTQHPCHDHPDEQGQRQPRGEVGDLRQQLPERARGRAVAEERHGQAEGRAQRGRRLEQRHQAAAVRAIFAKFFRQRIERVKRAGIASALPAKFGGGAGGSGNGASRGAADILELEIAGQAADHFWIDDAAGDTAFHDQVAVGAGCGRRHA
jgi:hypothetical protein